MRPSRTIARLGTFACLFVTAFLWARTALQSSAAPSDAFEMPGSLAANADGDVYVSFGSDYWVRVVKRFNPDGVPLARWSVSGGSDIRPYHVAEAHDGGVYVALDDLGVVRHYSRDGQQTAEWPVAGLESAIATTPGGSIDTDVCVVTSLLGGGSAVLRYGPSGSLGASFPVDRSSYDLGVVAPGQNGGSEVIVAAGPKQLGTELSRYRLDGTKVGTWETSDGYDVAGIDVDAATGLVWIGLSQRFVEGTGGLGGFTRDGRRAAWCELPAQPIDVTVGRNGDIHVLAFGDTDDPQRNSRRQVLRYRFDPWCTLVDTWDLEHLNGLVEPTPTGPTVAPSDTPTATALAATATEPPGSASPSTTPSPRPTPTYHTECGGMLFLPRASRSTG